MIMWMMPSCRYRALGTGSWRDGLAIIRWSSSWIRDRRLCHILCIRLWSKALRGANGTGIGVSGCSHCVVSMLSMFVNDRLDNWHEFLPYIMHAYRTSVHESTGYSPFRLMMGEECSLPQDVSTAELRANREQDISPHPFATWVRDALEVCYDHVRESLHRTSARRKQLHDIKAVNRKFPIGSWVLRYYPPVAQHKLGSPWIGPNQVIR